MSSLWDSAIIAGLVTLLVNYAWRKIERFLSRPKLMFDDIVLWELKSITMGPAKIYLHMKIKMWIRNDSGRNTTVTKLSVGLGGVRKLQYLDKPMTPLNLEEGSAGVTEFNWTFKDNTFDKMATKLRESEDLIVTVYHSYGAISKTIGLSPFREGIEKQLAGKYHLVILYQRTKGEGEAVRPEPEW